MRRRLIARLTVLLAFGPSGVPHLAAPVQAAASSLSSHGHAPERTGATSRPTVAMIVSANASDPLRLAAAIASAVAIDPGLAGAVATFAATAPPAQQRTLGAGLARAATSLSIGDAPAARNIAAAIASSPAATIAGAVETSPDLALPLASLASNEPPAQQGAVGQGLAQAAIFFAQSGAPNAVQILQEIQAAIASSPSLASSAFTASGGETAMLQTLAQSGGGPTLTTSSCVSPSRFGNGC